MLQKGHNNFNKNGSMAKIVDWGTYAIQRVKPTKETG
jgi:hypothetical protein